MGEAKPEKASSTPAGEFLAAGAWSGPTRRILSEELFGDAEEVVIEHNGKLYLLRKQPLGGLVLTRLDLAP